MTDVTLYVDSNTEGCKYVSDVRIYNQQNDGFTPVHIEHETGLSVKYNLGPLDPLTNCYLLVSTAVRREAPFASEAEVTYRVEYGEQKIESKIEHAKFDDVGFAFLNFTFRFCPRFPFC